MHIISERCCCFGRLCDSDNTHNINNCLYSHTLSI